MASSSREYLLGVSLVAFVCIFTWLAVSRLVTGSPIFDFSGKEQSTEYRSGAYRLSIELQPATPVAGDNRLELQVHDGQGMNVTAAQVRMVLQDPAAAEPDAHKGSALSLSENSPGAYTGNFALPHEGAWKLWVEVNAAETGHADLAFDLSTGSPGLTLVESTPVGKTHYTCPMHPSVKQTEPGQCPICGMDLTPITEATDEISHYTCPMHPSVKTTEPGQCPICGMDLTPVTQAEKAAGSVIVDQRRRQLIGLKTAPVTRGDLHDSLRLVGEVEYDPAALTDIAMPHGGKIGKLFVVYEGTDVKKGDPLFTVSSPDLYHAETDLVQLLEKGAKPEDNEVQEARTRLIGLGLNDTEVNELIAKRQPQAYRTIHSPVDGTLVVNQIRAGSVYWIGDTLMQIAERSRIRVKAAAYENDVKYIRERMSATVILPYVSPKPFDGEVDYINPMLQERDHTADVFVQADWQGPTVLAHSYADVYLNIELQDQLLVPEQAVIHAGDSRVVFVDEGEGRLTPRRIKTGRRNRDYIQVLEGLEENEVVVTSGNFLLASESKLKSGIDQW